MVGSRRRARAIALQALYEIDATGHEAEEALTRLLPGEELSEENVSFVRELVTGVIRNKAKIDQNIRNFAPAAAMGRALSTEAALANLAGDLEKRGKI